jgi:hypothetical protein
MPDEKKGLDSIDRDYCAFRRGSEGSGFSEFGCKPVEGNVEGFGNSRSHRQSVLQDRRRFYRRRQNRKGIGVRRTIARISVSFGLGCIGF